MEQMVSRRKANQREVIRYKNHASAKETQPFESRVSLSVAWTDLLLKAVGAGTWVKVLMRVERLLQPLLGSEGSDRPQALKRRGQMGEDGTPGYRGQPKAFSGFTQHRHQTSIHEMFARQGVRWAYLWTRVAWCLATCRGRSVSGTRRQAAAGRRGWGWEGWRRLPRRPLPHSVKITGSDNSRNIRYNQNNLPTHAKKSPLTW